MCILLNYKGLVPHASWVTCCVAADRVFYFYSNPLLAPGADYPAMSFIFVYQYKKSVELGNHLRVYPHMSIVPRDAVALQGTQARSSSFLIFPTFAFISSRLSSIKFVLASFGDFEPYVFFVFFTHMNISYSLRRTKHIAIYRIHVAD